MNRTSTTLLITGLAALGTVAAACSGGGSYGGGATSNAPASSAPAASNPAGGGGALSLSTRSGPLGTFLVDNSGKTVYLFEADKNGTSACSGACATAWPPVTGKPSAGSGVTADHLGTITRADGSTQATYFGHPLYHFFKDTTAGDTKGQGLNAFGAPWYVLDPAGNKIDKD